MSSGNDFSHSIQRAQKTHVSTKVDYKSHSLFGTHRKRTCQEKLPQASNSVRHSQKVHMLIKIDLKSRTLLGLDTDRRSVDFRSYLRTLSLRRVNSSLALDSTLGYSSFLLLL